VLGDFEPAFPAGGEASFDQGLQSGLDALGRGPQKLRQFVDVYLVVPEIGEDAQQFVEGDGLGPEVWHPADVQTGAASPRPLLPRRCKPNSLHPEASIAAKGEALYI
jgi:hypothetical protein